MQVTKFEDFSNTFKDCSYNLTKTSEITKTTLRILTTIGQAYGVLQSMMYSHSCVTSSNNGSRYSIISSNSENCRTCNIL